MHGKDVCAAAGGGRRAADEGAPDDADHEGTSEIALQGLAAAALKDAHAEREQHGGDGHVRDPHGRKCPDRNEGEHDAVSTPAYLGEHPQHEAAGKPGFRHGCGEPHSAHEEHDG